MYRQQNVSEKAGCTHLMNISITCCRTWDPICLNIAQVSNLTVGNARYTGESEVFINWCELCITLQTYCLYTVQRPEVEHKDDTLYLG
jgi:hypothetical protein